MLVYTDIIGLYLLCERRLAFVLASFRVIVYRSRYNSGEIAVNCPDMVKRTTSYLLTKV